MNGALNLSSGPHVRDRWTTSFIMKMVLLALLPATVVGVAAYGLNALLIVVVSMATAMVTEYLFNEACHKPQTCWDCSALVTGLMLALCLSPDVPLYIPILGSVFAILVVKCCFGGLGKNFVNPALAARCFLLISFGTTMTRFRVDGVTAATPIAALNAGKSVDVTSLFLGTANGVIGSSAIALLAGGLFLWSLEIIHGEICFSVLGCFTVLMGLFGGQGFDPKYLAAQLSGGGVMLSAFFMATDYVTSPVSRLGQLTYGMLIGGLGALFRLKGGTADSFSYCVIIGNLFTPLIDTYIVAKPYAYKRLRRRRWEEPGRAASGFTVPRPVIVLTAITLIAGLALGGVFALTKNTIEEQNLAAARAAYKAVCPGAETFEATPAIEDALGELDGGTYGSGFGRVTIDEAFAALDASGEAVGYAIRVTSADGFDGNVSLAVGLDAEGRVNGLSFTELHETPGMGMRVDEDLFKGQFAGRLVEKFTLNKAGGSSADDEIDSVSGASTTSGAVVNAVNAALDFFRTRLKGGM